MTAERAVVTRVAGARCWFTIERLTGTEDLGGPHGAPILIPAGAVNSDQTGDTSGGVGDPAFAAHHHSIDLRPLEIGDLIAVISIGGVADDWIALGRLPT